jgi:DNA-binding MarR family transcriptional regulator
MTGKASAKDKLRVWLRLLRTSRAIEAHIRERLRVTFATTLPRFDVLAALERSETGLTMTELSRELLVSNGNVTGLIERLVGDRLVARAEDSADRRATRVQLTAKGRRDFAVMAAAHEAWVGELLQDFDAADAAILNDLLARADPARDLHVPSLRKKVPA